MTITIVGVDCATRSAKVGMALAESSADWARLLNIISGSSQHKPTDQIVQWIEGKRPVLLALDAPLGWPAPLGDQLSRHLAGMPIESPASDLFRRDTDRFVEEALRKRPLEVGANLIARTAVSALQLLAELRERLGDPIPLAWSEVDLPQISAIEVYPAATLRARSLPSEGYKGVKGYEVRVKLLEALAREITIEPDSSEILANDNIFDAVVCALAGIDFVTGKAVSPPDRELAEKEGWIWFKGPDPAKPDSVTGDT
jgi:hypothetical protein